MGLVVGYMIHDPPKSPLRRGTLSLSVGLERAIDFLRNEPFGLSQFFDFLENRRIFEDLCRIIGRAELF
jgi:hypothetical protein